MLTVFFFKSTNFRMVHAFTCAGVLPSQYTNMMKFAGIGFVGEGYINQG